MVVESGDEIFVPTDMLGQKKVNVKWQQMMKQREETYVICKYENKTRANDSENKGLIFIQESKLQEFKGKGSGGSDVTLKIDGAFQYGQKKGGTDRWICYHDKGNKPYQHRFVEPVIAKYGNMAAGMISSAGYEQVNTVADATKAYIGDYLKDF